MRRLSTLASLVTAALLISAPLALAAPAAQPAPQTASPPLSAGIGMNGATQLLWEPPDQLNADLDAVRGAGVGWVRLDIDWSSIENVRGRLDWANTDRVVDAARSRGIKVMGITTYTPRWAQDPSVAPGTTHGRPASAAQFGTFAGQAAAHFSGKIDTWEIWNEPNLSSFFTPRVDATFYTDMVKASSSAIHAAAPRATVLAGAMAPASDSADHSEQSPLSFLQQMYAAGVKNSIDAISVHPYSYPALASGTQTWNAFYQLRFLHDTMVRNGDSQKKIWVTEFGAPTGPGQRAVSEDQQAAIIASGITLARSLSYVGPLFIYEIRDSRTGSSDIENNFGLLHTDRTPKPAYNAVTQQAKSETTSPTPPDITTTPPPAPAPAPGVFDLPAIWTWLLALLTTWFH